MRLAGLSGCSGDRVCGLGKQLQELNQKLEGEELAEAAWEIWMKGLRLNAHSVQGGMNPF